MRRRAKNTKAKSQPRPEPPLPPCPFPMEVIWPGIHKLRPDIAAREAEQFLAYGAAPDGELLDDPTTQSWLTDPALKFTDFQVSPVPPEWTALTDTLPDWRADGAADVADAILADLRVRVPNLRPDLVVAIMEDKEVWICHG